MSIKSILIISALAGIALDAVSQRNESSPIYKYTTELGLSSNTIYQVLQDRFGFIWIGTEEGLNRFDGKNFTVFSMGKGRYSLSHNRTQALLLAPDGNIWAGTSDGLNIYDYRTDSIIKVRTNTSPLKLMYNDITVLKRSFDNKVIWIGTYGDGLHFFDINRKIFRKFSLPVLKGNGYPSNIMSILEDYNRRIWMGTNRDGLYMYDRVNRSMVHFIMPENASFIRTIYQDNFKRIWIGTSKGCYIFNETRNRLDPVTNPVFLKNTSIGIITGDRNGKIWIGSELFIMSFSARLFSMSDKFQYQIITQGESTSKLNCPSVNALFSDRDNNIWIGTAWGGLNMLQGTPFKFRLYKHEAEDNNSLPSAPVSSLCTDGYGNLVIASEMSPIYRMNLKDGEINRFSPAGSFSKNIYQAMMYDSEGNLWLGTYNEGLLKIDRNNKTSGFTYNEKNSRSLPNNDIRCFCETRDRNIWIGTSNGLALYDRKSNNFIRVTPQQKHLGIRCIKEAANGILWIGTYGDGVITYDFRSNRINLNPVKNNIKVVSDILIDGNRIWVSSMGEGLMLYLQSGKRRIAYTDANGLSCNYIRSLLRDRNSNIWMGTSRGISKLNPSSGEIENFTTQDGLQSREYQERCALSLPNGNMAFGGYEGLNIFNPDNVKKNDKCPPVVFTRLLVNNDVIFPGGKRSSCLKKNISFADRIKLKHGQSIFTVEFMGINYNANQKIHYAYILEGIDKRWNYIGNQNRVTFRNLHHGRYILKVKASSPDGVWNEKKYSSIEIIVMPPFWQTWWAYSLYLIFAGIVIYFVWQFLTIRVRTANYLKIERAKREKDEELMQEKLQFFTNISHEFRTPLTLIIGPLEKLQLEESDETKKKHIKLMLLNAKRLLLMVNQLLDFRKADRGQMQLQVQYADMVKFIREIMQSFEELKIQKNIQFDMEHDQETIMCWFDPAFIDKSMFNLLTNAFKFTPDYGAISISVKEKEVERGSKCVEISVKDNGSGILEKDINNIFDRFYQGKDNVNNIQQGSGIGLHLTKNLIELHHGTITVESIPKFRTIFKITIPSEKRDYSKNEISETSNVEARQFSQYSLINMDIGELKQAESDNNHGSKKKKILIVDDNPEICSYMKDILGDDYETKVAENGLEGLNLVRNEEFDLIVSDIMMPEMNGLEMCKSIKSNIETSHIPIILLTAKTSVESEIEGLNIGADSYISKPFHPEYLRVRINKLIEQREKLREYYNRKISLVDFKKGDSEAPVSPDEKFLKKAISIIINRMTDPDFNGDVLASDLNISRMGLYRKIKALTNQSSGEFIKTVRLKKACELLCDQGKNVSEVSYEVGFNSPSYFTTCFTEFYKMTPSEYVKNCHKK